MPTTKRRFHDVVVASIAGIGVAATVTALIVLAVRTWTPFNDNAVIWLHVDDVGTGDTPLTGLYSRFGWDHPGPLVFYLLSLPFRMLDGRPSALLVGALLIAVVASTIAIGTAYRAGSFGAAIPVGIVTVIVAVSLSGGLIDPWTPYTVVLPMMAFVCALWAWLGAERFALPLAVAVGTFLAQTHVSLTVPVVLIGIVAVTWRFIEQTPPQPTWRRPPWGTLIVLAVLWAPPVAQQLFGQEGNLTALWSHFTTSSDTTTGFADGLGRSARALWPAGPWVGRTGDLFLGQISLAPVWWLAAPISLLAVTALIARRWKDPVTTRLVGLVAAGQVAAVLAMARIEGIPFAYLTYWSRAIAALTVAAPFVTVGRRLLAPAQDRSNSHRPAIAVIGVTIAVIAITGMSRPSPTDDLGSQYRALLADVPAAVPPGTTVRVDAAGEALAYSAPTLVIAFEQQGRRALLAPLPGSGDGFDIAGEARGAPADDILPTFVVASGPSVDVFAARPGARVVSSVDPLTPAERAEAQALQASLREQAWRIDRPDLAETLGEPGALAGAAIEGIDALDVARYLELTGRGTRIAVVQLPPTTWPAP